MRTNFYALAYPLATRMRMDNIFNELVTLLDIKLPLASSSHYVLVALGEPSGLEAYDITQRAIDFATRDSGLFRHPVSYRDEFHGILSPDGRQIYPFGIRIRPYTDESLKDRMFRELISIRDSDLPSVVPGLRAVHLGLTFWGLYYPGRQMAELAQTRTERYLKQKGLQVVSTIQSTDGERIVALPEKES